MQQNMSKLIVWAAISSAAAVAIGAFGAHGLKPHLSAYQLGIYEKGVQYQFYHSLALLACGVLASISGPSRQLLWAGRLFIIGILCFSGSLYLLACADLLPFPVRWAGPVTPLGGLSFIAGWLALLWRR